MKIGVSSWSLNKEFVNNKVNMLDFIRIAKEEFGVDAIETVHWMIGNNTPENLDRIRYATEQWSSPTSQEELRAASMGFMKAMTEISISRPDNLEQIKAALDQYGVKVLNMPIDYGNISEVDEEKRKADLAVIKIWIDVAAFLGSKGARVNTGHQPEGVFDLSITAASYRELAEYAQKQGVALVLENHGGMSADPKNILKLFEMVNHPNFRICPDFGNFDAAIRYDALDTIFNNPLLVHAKTYDFDENGNHVKFDFGKCMEIAGKHNYNGYYSVEFEGAGEQYDGINKSISLLKRYI